MTGAADRRHPLARPGDLCLQRSNGMMIINIIIIATVVSAVAAAPTITTKTAIMTIVGMH